MRATSVRALHQLPPMPEALAEGCEPFLSKRTTQLLWTQWQAGLLQRLNDEVQSTPLAAESVVETVMGEPPEIHAFLGSSRLAETIDRYDNVKLVVHGHAHRGAHEGRTNKGVPVYNVALPVLRTLGDTPYRVFEI